MKAAVILAVGCGLAACKRDPDGSPSPRAAESSPADASTPTMSASALDAREPIDASTDDDLTRGMVLIPAGSFFAGCEGTWDDCPNVMVEQPMGVFFIDRHEVTVAAYRACVERGRCTEPAPGRSCDPSLLNWSREPSELDEHPVNCVAPRQAETFCRWRGMHLPTRMQFEKAARGMDDKRAYPWGDAPPSCERVIMNEDPQRGPARAGCGRGRTWPVGSRPSGASPFGVLDLSGNVDELVISDSGGTIDASGVDVELPLDRLELSTAAQGGSFASGVRVELYAPSAGVSTAHTGFRCVYVPPSSPEWKRIRARFVF